MRQTPLAEQGRDGDDRLTAVLPADYASPFAVETVDKGGRRCPLKIVNPSFGLQPESAHAAKAQAAATDWTRDPIAIVSNSKANAQALLEGVRDLMGAFRPTANIDYFYKDSAAKPAPPDLIEHIAKNYKGAILALAD